MIWGDGLNYLKSLAKTHPEVLLKWIASRRSGVDHTYSSPKMQPIPEGALAIRSTSLQFDLTILIHPNQEWKTLELQTFQEVSIFERWNLMQPTW